MKYIYYVLYINYIKVLIAFINKIFAIIKDIIGFIKTSDLPQLLQFLDPLLYVCLSELQPLLLQLFGEQFLPEGLLLCEDAAQRPQEKEYSDVRHLTTDWLWLPRFLPTTASFKDLEVPYLRIWRISGYRSYSTVFYFDEPVIISVSGWKILQIISS